LTFMQKNFNLNTYSNWTKYNNYSKKKPLKLTVKYSFSYVSLITPHKILNIRLFTNHSLFQSKKQKKLFVKQSYLLMTWLWYIQSKFLTKHKKPSFAFKPTKYHKTTLIKSPMAHKTFSQEQFQFKFFYIIISLPINLSVKNFNIYSANQLLFLIYSLRQKIPFVETNFFLLKSFSILIPFKNQKFLTV